LDKVRQYWPLYKKKETTTGSQSRNNDALEVIDAAILRYYYVTVCEREGMGIGSSHGDGTSCWQLWWHRCEQMVARLWYHTDVIHMMSYMKTGRPPNNNEEQADDTPLCVDYVPSSKIHHDGITTGVTKVEFGFELTAQKSVTYISEELFTLHTPYNGVSNTHR
jgi:hypothetical protein